MIRRLGLSFISVLLSPFVFRLSVGRWPSASENRQFALALRETGAPVPAIPRALVAVPAARAQIANMIKLYMIQQGKLPKPDSNELPPRTGNALHFWQGPPVTFLHFERTAGTTLAAALIDECHPLQVSRQPFVQDGLLLAAPEAELAAEALGDCKFIWGHYDLPTLRRLGPGRVIITMLREPAARILSLYYFWRSIQPSRLDIMADSRVVLAQRLNLLDFLHSEDRAVRDSIDNIYVRRLTGLYTDATSPDPLEANPDRAVSRALDALNDVACVGISEHMSRSLTSLGSVLGIGLSTSTTRENVQAANAAAHPTLYRQVAKEDITPAIEDALARLVRLDRVIYETCRQRLVSPPA